MSIPRVLVLRLYATDPASGSAPRCICEDPLNGRQTAFGTAEELWRIVEAHRLAGSRPRTRNSAAPTDPRASTSTPKESP